jgi:hypothetical protein
VDDKDGTLTREELVASVDSWTLLKDFAFPGELDGTTNADPLGVVIWWEPSANDNNWNVNNGRTTTDGQPLHIDLGVALSATQLEAESDSFGSDYDAEAELPMVAGGTLSVGNVTVTVPSTAPAGIYKLAVTDYSLTTVNNSLTDPTDLTEPTTLLANITLTRDGKPVADSNVEYTVEIQADIMSKDHKLYHNDVEITDFAYSIYTGIVSFKTSSFSPFKLTYDIFGHEVDFEEDDKSIIHGFFEDGIGSDSLVGRVAAVHEAKHRVIE